MEKSRNTIHVYFGDCIVILEEKHYFYFFFRSKDCAEITMTIKWTIFKRLTGEYLKYLHYCLAIRGNSSPIVFRRLKYE